MMLYLAGGTMVRRFGSSAAVAVCLVLAIVLSLSAQSPSSQQQAAGGQGTQRPPAGETAGQSSQFKNIKVLKDIPADQLVPSMRFITAALGVDCDYCHVGDTDGHHNFDKDDKRPKQTARQMMEMTRNINQASFGGRNQVNCATCHQGHPEPSPIPPVMDEARLKERLAVEARLRAQQAQATPPAPAAPAQPSAQPVPAIPGAAAPAPAQQGPNQQAAQAAQAAADQLFAKYEQAIGGDAAIDKFTSRLLSGDVVTGTGAKLKIAIRQKPPDRTLVVLTLPNGAMQRTAYDGVNAWVAAGTQVQPLEGIELAVFKLGSSFFHNQKLKGQCARAFALPRKEQLNGRDVNVVRCQVPGNQIQEVFYFDSDTGFLLRRLTAYRTALGPIQQQTDYSDYREVEGVKIPFVTRQARPDSFSTVTWSDVKYNVPVNDADFAMPKAAGNKPTGQ
jgi:hypothetical protein